jgi:hypothetical protein
MNGFWPPPPAHWILPEKREQEERKRRLYTVKKEREFRRGDRVQNHIQYDEGLPP